MEISSILVTAFPGSPPKVRVASDGHDYWPVSVYIEPYPYGNPTIAIHFRGEADYVAFKNSVIQSYDKYLKENYG